MSGVSNEINNCLTYFDTSKKDNNTKTPVLTLLIWTTKPSTLCQDNTSRPAAMNVCSYLRFALKVHQVESIKDVADSKKGPTRTVKILNIVPMKPDSSSSKKLYSLPAP